MEPLALMLLQSPRRSPKPLPMQLVFSNGATEPWHLGRKTAQAVQGLVQQNQKLSELDTQITAFSTSQTHLSVEGARRCARTRK